MMRSSIIAIFLLVSSCVSLPYLPEFEDYNLNQNKDAKSPLEYWGERKDHEYHPSPKNWRMPFYSLFLDRFVNGDPSNDNINGTAFEVDILSTQLRAGGDVKGLLDTLDYLQGMGIKALYIAGSAFINQPWSADAFSPLDLTLLDQHFGNITMWRALTDEIHRRGMYIILENTMSTMGDLVGFQGFLNETAPFKFDEHDAMYKSSRRYWDFDLDNRMTDECEYPRFWDEHGERLGGDVTSQMKSCRKSDFDQYGDVESFGKYPEWQKQLSKFSFVQDRLREWQPSVLDKIKLFSCITVAALDIDGFRIDKALTITVDAQADWSEYMRECARKLGKDNFFIPGEIVGGNALAALYVGRGKEPPMYAETVEDAFNATNTTDVDAYIRPKVALDAACFHYSIYRSLTRFLGIDGVYGAEMDTRTNWAEGWEDIVLTNDMVNTNTGEFDPRHMFGVSNHDVFRWPGILNGTHRFLVGQFITTLLMPGIPIVSWGDEQSLYILESIAGNYLYGRQPMTSTMAWEMHGCYKVGSEKYFNFPLDAALYGCEDANVSLDHRDPAHPTRNIIKRMLELRTQYPVLNDGFDMVQLSNHTHWIYLAGSNGTGTELGLWSNVRMGRDDIQDFSSEPGGNQMVWLLFGNENATADYEFDCSNEKTALTSPFPAGTTVKNLFSPYEEYTLQESTRKLGLDGADTFNGCLDKLTMPAWAYKALVPVEAWTDPRPAITKFLPGHDYRLETFEGTPTVVGIEIHFSHQMDCDSVGKSIEIESETSGARTAKLDRTSIECENIAKDEQTSAVFSGEVPSIWRFTATLTEVDDGVHRITVRDPKAQDANAGTDATDHFLLRAGRSDNPVVFPRHANHSSELVVKRDDNLFVRHRAPGASRFRCSSNWASTWTDWLAYDGTEFSMPPQPWSGTARQEWAGDHVICQYYSQLAGSSHHQQQGDAAGTDRTRTPRQFPHLFLNGDFNEFGFDAGIPNEMRQDGDGNWILDLMTEWPTRTQFNVWGVNPDGLPDQTWVFGDVNFDHVLDRLPPGSLRQNLVNFTDVPPVPFTGWRVSVDSLSMEYSRQPTGSRGRQIAVFALFWVLPPVTAFAVVACFVMFFYKVKLNTQGTHKKLGISEKMAASTTSLVRQLRSGLRPQEDEPTPRLPFQSEIASNIRRKVLVATLEYDIEDWGITIKIGGLGVIAKLMTKALQHLDIIWVIPCVGGLPEEYPVDEVGEDMNIVILGTEHRVRVQYHVLRNITYVLLDAPVFRQQTKANPYPARMDDMDSAIYYSAWNQCIAEAIKRFSPDIYHINDYHGAIAPLYLLPQTLPCCLSLHNAEFQGMWPMGTKGESDEVCRVFNLDEKLVQRYVQYGSVFNLLNGAVCYIREFQSGFGVIGVSEKYGKRSLARYPIFWGLSTIGSIPNPDPTDTLDWDPDHERQEAMAAVEVDRDYEARRLVRRQELQEWAGLNVDAQAEPFVFVGRWSTQKGIDLIADVFPSVLESNAKAQLVCVGPLVDLHGRFAAMKLEKMMENYPGRVFSRPEFVKLPDCVFEGAEFALIPSRDEPFGLVAVEFGRKGALGIGARVGGLGNMPGWYYTVESTSAKHLTRQFSEAIHNALASDAEERAVMRATAAKQRFPVVQWVDKVETLHTTSILKFDKRSTASRRASPLHLLAPPSRPHTHYESGDEGSEPGTPASGGIIEAPAGVLARSNSLSIRNVIRGRRDFQLQQVDPFFNDEDGKAAERFREKLAKLDAKSSTTELCIEQNLIKSERAWFDQYKATKHGMASLRASDFASIHKRHRSSTITTPPSSSNSTPPSPRESVHWGPDGEVHLDAAPDDSNSPTRASIGFLRKLMLIKILNWPIYAMILALGQILATNSYQITLLNGEIGQTANMLYTIASIYAGSSIVWFWIYRTYPAVGVLSPPFVMYGIAFLFVGLAPFSKTAEQRDWVQKVATGMYAAASSSGSLYFALNFGDEGGAPVKTWVRRACIVQGLQHVYSSALWYWGSALSSSARTTGTIQRASDVTITSTCIPLAVLMIFLGAVTFKALPEYYRQSPGTIPSFVPSLFRRNLVKCFIAAVMIQNFWLASTYGRSWRFLWTTEAATAWQILLLLVLFFGVVWVLIFTGLASLSREHPWLFPVLAIGLGAPRWCQTLWAISGVGSTLPWVLGGSAAAGALVARALWLWLGVLDALQLVGFGMMLLQTMTRLHNSTVLIMAQVFGSLATILGRGVSPAAVGPGPVFPNLALSVAGLASGWFWVCLLMQLSICVLFALFFRREQLSKP